MQRECFLSAARTLCAGAMLLMMLGCGGSGPEHPAVGKVKGKVLFKGEPLAGATITFYGPGSGIASTGVSNDAGEFELTTYETGDGAPVGENTVTVSKYEGGEVASIDPTKMAAGGPDVSMTPGSTKPPKSVIPEHYSNVASTPLKVTIEADKENTPTLELN